jgi:mannan endo-1,4-beta-mannosidase
MFLRTLTILGILIMVQACKPNPEISSKEKLSDPKASNMATALFNNLQTLSANHVLVGHQDALAYGMGWKGEAFRTDINDVLDDHPAVFWGARGPQGAFKKKE